MCFETKKDLKQKIEWLENNKRLDKWLLDNYQELAIETQERNLELLKENINLEEQLKESDDLLVEKIIENKKLKEEIDNMKPKRNFNVGQLIEYRGDVYEVAYQMNVCVALSGVSSKVKCTLITVDRNSSELIEL